MYYIFLAAITAFFSAPQMAYEQAPTTDAIKPQQVEQITAPQILEKIAYCESQGRHFDDDGNVLVGANRNDIGKYQINAIYWQSLAEKLGYNIYTEEGNKAMAMELYRRYGTGPWRWSKKCWNK